MSRSLRFLHVPQLSLLFALGGLASAGCLTVDPEPDTESDDEEMEGSSGDEEHGGGDEPSDPGMGGSGGSSGIRGADGVSLVWLGSEPSAPVDCDPETENNAYYNSTDGVSYICDGDEWGVLNRDGDSASSVNAVGTIASGQALTLTHNLGREDLVFTAQFVKNGLVYDYDDWFDNFGYRYRPYAEVSDPVVFDAEGFNQMSSQGVALLPSGNMFVVYQGESEGTPSSKIAVIDQEGQIVTTPRAISEDRFDNDVVALSEGNVLVVSREWDGATATLHLVTYDEAGDAVGTPVELTESWQIRETALTRLNDGRALIAYSGSGQQHFAIYDAVANTTSSPVQVGDGYEALTTVQLNNGNLMFAFWETWPDPVGAAITISIFSPEGDQVLAPTRVGSSYNSVLPDTGSPLEALVLPGGDVRIWGVEEDSGDFNTVVVDPAGGVVQSPTDSAPVGVNDYSVSLLADGNVLVGHYVSSFTALDSGFSVLDPWGNVVQAATNITEGRFVSGVPLPQGGFALLYGDANEGFSAGPATFARFRIPGLDLEPVSDNEVRLWNYTGEELDLVLSVVP